MGATMKQNGLNTKFSDQSVNPSTKNNIEVSPLLNYMHPTEKTTKLH